MLPDPNSLYHVAQLRHQELIAEAEQYRLANQAKGELPRPVRVRAGLARHLAALISVWFRWVTVGREYARFEIWR